MENTTGATVALFILTGIGLLVWFAFAYRADNQYLAGISGTSYTIRPRHTRLVGFATLYAMAVLTWFMPLVLRFGLFSLAGLVSGILVLLPATGIFVALLFRHKKWRVYIDGETGKACALGQGENEFCLTDPAIVLCEEYGRVRYTENYTFTGYTLKRGAAKIVYIPKDHLGGEALAKKMKLLKKYANKNPSQF